MPRYLAGEFSVALPTEEQRQRLEDHRDSFRNAYADFALNLFHALYPGDDVAWYEMTQDQAAVVLKHLDAIAKDRAGGDNPAPSVDDLVGIAPDYTGEISSDEFIRRQRGEDKEA